MPTMFSMYFLCSEGTMALRLTFHTSPSAGMSPAPAQQAQSTAVLHPGSVLLRLALLSGGAVFAAMGTFWPIFSDMHPVRLMSIHDARSIL